MSLNYEIVYQVLCQIVVVEVPVLFVPYHLAWLELLNSDKGVYIVLNHHTFWSHMYFMHTFMWDHCEPIEMF